MGQGIPVVSVVVPTRNGGGTWRDTLVSLLGQELEYPFELIVIDTDSSDGTPELTERLCTEHAIMRPGTFFRTVKIGRSEFRHGRTRNLGARLARGEIVVFLSQDATPVGSHWLSTFMRAFDDPAIVGAFCRQVAQPDASLPEQFILDCAYPGTSSRRTRDSLALRDAGYILFSNAAGAIRREELLARPFREDVMMCEDTHWAVEVLLADRMIAYVAEATVRHSHHYTLRAILARNFDFGVTLQGLPGSLGMGSYVRYLVREQAFVRRRNGLKGLPWMMAFEFARCSGYVLGSMHQRLPQGVCWRLSGYPDWFRAESSRQPSNPASNPVP